MKIKSLFLASLLGASGLTQAADLLETFRAAQSSDPVFASARAAQQVGQEKLPQGRALLLPTVNLSAASTYNDNNIQYLGRTIFLGGNYRYNNNGYNLSLVQPLFRQQNWLAYNEAELQVAQTEAQFKLAEQDLVLRTAQAYFEVLIAQDSVQLAEAQKRAITEQLAQARRNFELGSATITDSQEAQARFDLTRSLEIAAQNNLAIKQRMLQQLTNMPPAELKILGKNFKLLSPQPVNMDQWIADAQLNNPQLAIAQAAVQLADKEVERQRGGHYPTLDLVANYGKNHASGGTFGVGSDSRNANIGVQLNVPLFQGGAVNSKWREAEGNRERARAELENARRTVATQTSLAYLGVVSGIAQVQALQQALTSSESLLQASKLGQEVGVRTNLDVLNAQQQLFATRRDLYQAEYNYLLSQLRLRAAAGGLGESELAQVNQALY